MPHYKIRDEFSNKTALVTLIGNEAVNLLGVKLKIVIPAQFNRVAQTRIVRGATQKDLEFLYKQGNPCICYK